MKEMSGIRNEKCIENKEARMFIKTGVPFVESATFAINAMFSRLAQPMKQLF